MQLGCVAALNLPLAGRLGSSPAVLYNFFLIIVSLAVGFGVAQMADADLGPASFIGVPRSRRLIFVLFGGYFFACNLGVIGSQMLLSGKPSIPFALRMPDTSLLTMSALVWLLSLLTKPNSERQRWLRRYSGWILIGLTTLAGWEVWRLHTTGVDTFRLICSGYLLVAWTLLLQTMKTKAGSTGRSVPP